ncbi:hypothetical protein B0H67DRAFT_45706 [Lasiosphaeris hirsuta]|uniref:Peptidase M3A/M3B catalytic domain-containing protein n=1 Tax=Lasiosphaeris hirsuta TaxID=260670 RepID=A0AA40E724_9PEZI|nr:hypothetical protein B0H67DRAFT_45706 [Lasiosphaeris hirsuta]
MVQTPETVTSLLAEIRQRIRPVSLEKLSELLASKKEDAVSRDQPEPPNTSGSFHGIKPAMIKSVTKRRMIVSGYEAGYFIYLLGRVHSLDMWTSSRFDAGGLDNLRKAGRRFRRCILEQGGSQPEMKTLADYLGRPPSSAAYFRWLGI